MGCPVQDALSHPFSYTSLNPLIQSDVNTYDNAQWARYPDEPVHVEGILSAAVSGANSFHSSSTNNVSQAQVMSGASWVDVNLSNRAESSSSTRTLSCFESSQEQHAKDLRDYLDKEPVTTHGLIQTYFAEIHPYWPILHAPSFNISNTPHVLLASMIVLVSRLDGKSDYLKLAPLVFDAVIAIFLVRNPFFLCVQKMVEHPCAGLQPLLWQRLAVSVAVIFTGSCVVLCGHDLLSCKCRACRVCRQNVGVAHQKR